MTQERKLTLILNSVESSTNYAHVFIFVYVCLMLKLKNLELLNLNVKHIQVEKCLECAESSTLCACFGIYDVHVSILI